MAFPSFEDLEFWKKSCRLAVETYRVVGRLRGYGLKNQMQRAAVSIASNIAEGSERGGRDFVRFLSVASGSCAELHSQWYIAKRILLLESHDFNEWVSSTKQTSKMIGVFKSH